MASDVDVDDIPYGKTLCITSETLYTLLRVIDNLN
jgi:hypothetical protein